MAADTEDGDDYRGARRVHKKDKHVFFSELSDEAGV